jgi:hypothetical protein
MKTLQIKLKNASYPKYRPSALRTLNFGTKRNPIMVKAVVYQHSKEFKIDFDTCPDGASAVFIPNKAAINNSEQFALKVFYNKDEAYPTWLRQKIAAKAGLAPPVGKMIIVLDKIGKIKHVGYQTAVCDMGESDSIEQRLVNKLSRNLARVKLPKECKIGFDQWDWDWADKKLTRLGEDLHKGNYGIWKGTLVCIDFGHDSLSE